MNFAENRGCCVTVYREMTETMREEERVKKQISRCHIYNYHGHNYGVWNGGLR